MKISAIIEQENENTNMVFLYKEGIFWKLYNQSALWWVQNIKPLKHNVKEIKYLKTHIVSVGFPVASWQNYEAILQQKNYKIKAVSDTEIALQNIQKPSIETCISTIKQLVAVQEQNLQLKEPSTLYSSSTDELLEAIKKFPLASKTPFEAMQFLVQLQQNIQ